MNIIIANAVKDAKSRLLFYTSEKANCTEVILYFFTLIDQLHDALEYSTWIHDYRWNVHVLTYPVYLTDFLTSDDCFLVKFVRCPYDRAVSIYFHYHKYLDINSNLSFYGFLSYLQSEFPNVHRHNKAVNEHLQTQSFLEELDTQLVKWNAVIHVEYLQEELEEIEMSLPKSVKECQTILAEYMKDLKSTHWTKNTTAKYLNQDMSNTPFHDLDLHNINYADMFHDIRVREMVETLYALDFQCHPEYTFDKFLLRNHAFSDG